MWLGMIPYNLCAYYKRGIQNGYNGVSPTQVPELFQSHLRFILINLLFKYSGANLFYPHRFVIYNVFRTDYNELNKTLNFITVELIVKEHILL